MSSFIGKMAVTVVMETITNPLAVYRNFIIVMSLIIVGVLASCIFDAVQNLMYRE